MSLYGFFGANYRKDTCVRDLGAFVFSEYLFVCLLKGMSYKTMLQNYEKNCQTDISLSFSLPHGFVAKVSLAIFCDDFENRKRRNLYQCKVGFFVPHVCRAVLFALEIRSSRKSWI